MHPARRHSTRLAPIVALALAPVLANAHDSWFQPLPDAGGARQLALGTGNRYPTYESAIDARYLVQQGCRSAAASRPVAMKPQRLDDTRLVLRAPAQAVTCWAQLAPFEVEVAPDKVPVYLKEIQASPELRATWAAMQARGLPWRERYTKHARVEFGGQAGAEPAPLGLDLLLETDGQTLRAGATVSARLLRDGAPLAGLPLELRSEQSPIGIWRRTDAEGRIAVTLPLTGRWVLRGVDLRVAAGDPDRWDSRFVTLAFEVLPRADQNASSLNSNTRSANQIAATTAIASEPPSSTTQR